MFCKYCGKEITDDSCFCKFCGKSLPTITQQETCEKNTYFYEEQKYGSFDVSSPNLTKEKKTNAVTEQTINNTKLQSECKELYIKNKELKSKSTNRMIFSLCSSGIALLFIVLTFVNVTNMNNLQEKYDNLNTKYSKILTEKRALNQQITEYRSLESFVDYSVRIVPADGSGKYHKYGCSYCDLSEGYWIYNVGNVEQRYYKCPYCIH